MPAARPRVLFVSPLPPPMGGIAKWMLAILASPLGERFELRVADSSPSKKDSVQGHSRLRADRAVDAFRILGRVAVELVRFRPAVVHVNTSYQWAFLRDGIALWIASAFGARTLIHFRGGDFPEFVQGLRPGLRRLAEATLRRADRLVALTHPTRVYLESIAPSARVRYVPNFVRPDEVAGPPEHGSGGARPVHVLFVGWILAAKGVRELLEAARAIPEARFTLVGPQERAFVDAIRSELAALEPRVRLLPERARAELAELYRDADVFVLPTWREGFPNVVLEAMAAGLPVVATPVGAIPDALRDGQEGLLVPPRDAAALTAALRRLVGDAALRAEMGARARERAESVFSERAVIAQLEAIYRELAE